MAQEKVFIVVLLICSLCAFPFTFALQCHTCIYVGGVLGDNNCKDSLYLTRTRTTYRSCNKDQDALNSKEIQAVKFMSPHVEYNVGCLKTIINAQGVDIMIRGCYGEISKPSASSPLSNSKCQSPSKAYWKQLKEGPLSGSKTPLDITKAKFDVCLCTDRDGCNSAYNFETLSFGALLLWGVIISAIN